MARFFAVNWAVAVGWLLLAIATTSSAVYWYGQVYGWHDAEATATAELQAKGINAEHYKTVEYGDTVRVLFAREQPGHYVDMTVQRARDGKWAVTKCNKDFAPCADEPALR